MTPKLPESILTLLAEGPVPFDRFMATALYDESSGYYAGSKNPVGPAGDFITSPHLSPLFGFALGRLAGELLSKSSSATLRVIDVGCGDGKLLRDLALSIGDEITDRVSLIGVDRRLGRATRSESIRYVSSLDEVPPGGPALCIANELYDAFPFCRVVQREAGLHELLVSLESGALEWAERPAREELRHYFSGRSIALATGQFADISPDWEHFHQKLLGQLQPGLAVVFDYGSEERNLFSPSFRRYGTAGAFSGHQVSRDLLSTPGQRDLTAHINWTDLDRAAVAAGASTLFRGSQARFLLGIGALEHPLLRSDDSEEITDVDQANARFEAKKLLLPDGIGEEMKVRVHAKGVPTEGWSFQRRI
jgi:SAM-dependent MidA family methyltransferase